MPPKLRRFKHDCKFCPRLGVSSPENSRECYACILRDIYSPDEILSCNFCKGPLEPGEECAECTAQIFDGRRSYLRSLEVCGIGNTDKPWENRPWRELGGAIAGVKGNQPHLYNPVRRLALFRLEEWQAKSSFQYNLVTYVPTARDLLPRLFADIYSRRERFGLGAATFDDSVLRKSTNESHGGDDGVPEARWRSYHEMDLYQLAKGEAVRGKRVLLIEDTYKSGCSMQMSAKRLLEGGADFVDGFAICRWPWPGTRPTLRAY